MINTQNFLNKSPYTLLISSWLVYLLCFSWLYEWLGRPAIAFFVIPLLISSFTGGRWAGFCAGLIAPILHAILFSLLGTASQGDFLGILFIASHAVYAVVGFSAGYMRDLKHQLGVELEERKKAEAQREELLQDLTKALQELKTLGGLLPICSKCKKIRDDSGYWEQMELYISKHSEASFTHSICPACTDELYGLEHEVKSVAK